MKLLSEINSIIPIPQDYYVAIFLGSFAPFHEGHIDVAKSALLKMNEIDMYVKYFIFCLHNDSTVKNKIKNANWPIERRVEFIKNQQHKFNTKIPILLNDVTCYKKMVTDMTTAAVKDVKKRFDINSNQIVIILGSDNSNTIKKYIKNHKIICVIRPGYPFLCSNNKKLILAERLLEYDISSSQLRKNYE